jgi:hypothetical protein
MHRSRVPAKKRWQNQTVIFLVMVKETLSGIKIDQVCFLPHFAQNFAPGLIGLPHSEQTEDSGGAAVTGAAGAGELTGAPQVLQNFLPGVTGLPQPGQVDVIATV